MYRLISTGTLGEKNNPTAAVFLFSSAQPREKRKVGWMRGSPPRTDDFMSRAPRLWARKEVPCPTPSLLAPCQKHNFQQSRGPTKFGSFFSTGVILLQRVSVRKLRLNFLIARRAGISYKSDQCPFHETFFPLSAYISDLEGGGHLAGRNGQFSPASPSADQAGSLHSRCKIYIQIIFGFFFFQRFLTQCLQCFMK